MSSVAVIGLGKLGLPLAAVIAEAGYRVFAADVNEVVVDAVNERAIVTTEPGLADLIATFPADQLVATTSVSDAVAASAVTFVIVPTPSDSEGLFSLEFVLDACRSIGAGMARSGRYHLVVIVSTVMPGATRDSIAPELEAASSLRLGEEFGLCYNPEFVALGQVLEGMRSPDFVLVGESDPRAGAELLSILQRVHHQPTLESRRLSFVDAEIAKLAVNNFVTTKISFANELAEMTERVAGADANQILDAVGLDRRIGRSYLSPGLGFGGPCFPRDNVALMAYAASIGTDAPVISGTHEVNERQVDRVVERVASEIRPGSSVSVLGLSYKPDTDVVEASQGLWIASELVKQGYRVTMHDPAALSTAKQILGESVHYANDIGEATGDAAAIIIATPWRDYEELPSALLTRRDPLPLLLDCWRQLDADVLDGRVAHYVVPGVR